MPFEVDTSGPIWRARFFDVLEVTDLINMGSTVAALEAGREFVPHRITTLTHVTHFNVGYLEVSELARRRRVVEIANSVKSALVAVTPAQLGFARMYQTLLDHPKINLEIFSEMHAAEEWTQA